MSHNNKKRSRIICFLIAIFPDELLINRDKDDVVFTHFSFIDRKINRKTNFFFFFNFGFLFIISHFNFAKSIIHSCIHSFMSESEHWFLFFIFQFSNLFDFTFIIICLKKKYIPTYIPFGNKKLFYFCIDN
jgi:hypothetical protein